MKKRQKLPIGLQGFEELRRNDYLYVDKTAKIYELLEGKYYFLSRHRRFGKPLTINMLKHIFLGQKELFKGLWIEDKLGWKPPSVIHLGFGMYDFKNLSLTEAITLCLEAIAEQYNTQLTSTDITNQFKSLIKSLSKENQVAILIDEYDKSISEYLGKEEIA